MDKERLLSNLAQIVFGGAKTKNEFKKSACMFCLLKSDKLSFLELLNTYCSLCFSTATFILKKVGPGKISTPYLSILITS